MSVDKLSRIGQTETGVVLNSCTLESPQTTVGEDETVTLRVSSNWTNQTSGLNSAEYDVLINGVVIGDGSVGFAPNETKTDEFTDAFLVGSSNPIVDGTNAVSISFGDTTLSCGTFHATISGIGGGGGELKLAGCAAPNELPRGGTATLRAQVSNETDAQANPTVEWFLDGQTVTSTSVTAPAGRSTEATADVSYSAAGGMGLADGSSHTVTAKLDGGTETACGTMFIPTPDEGNGDNGGTGGCSSDADCAGNSVCRNGECVFPDSGGNGGGGLSLDAGTLALGAGILVAGAGAFNWWQSRNSSRSPPKRNKSRRPPRV